MTYQTPTTATLKGRYPEFEPVPDARVDAILEDAIGQIGETWIERDRARARILLACHWMTAEDEPQRSITVAAGGNASVATGAVKRRKVGDVEVEMADTASASVSGGISREVLGSTVYGREYQRLLQMNFPGAATA